MALSTLTIFTIIIQLYALTLSAVITLPSTLSPTLETFHTLTNTSLQLNTTTPSLDFSIHCHPTTDPYSFHPSPALTIRVSTYGDPLPALDTLSALLLANEAAIAALATEGDGPLPPHLEYDSGEAGLSFVSAAGAGWRAWGEGLVGLGAFVRSWGGFECVFHVRLEGVEIGVGAFERGH